MTLQQGSAFGDPAVLALTETPAAAGRPRSDEVTHRVRIAARAVFAERGLASVTMAEIAASAGVGLDSIYRRWPAKQALLVDVVANVVAEEISVPDTGSLADDLQQLARGLIRAVNADLGPLLAAAVAEAAHDETLAGRLAEAQASRRAATTPIVQRALARGELHPDADGQLLLDALAGIVWQRTWLAGEPVSPDDAPRFVTELLAGFSAQAR